VVLVGVHGIVGGGIVVVVIVVGASVVGGIVVRVGRDGRGGPGAGNIKGSHIGG